MATLSKIGMKFASNPTVFALTARIQNSRYSLRHFVTPMCDLVLEGYPRSANTYLHRIIRAGSEGNLTIAHHVHWPQQVKMAVHYGVPSFLLFRDPLNAIASRLVRMGAQSRADEFVSQYIQFAEETLRNSANPNVHILMFDRVTAEPVRVSNDILLALNYSPIVTEEMVERVTMDDRADKLMSSLPNEEKADRKLRCVDDVLCVPSYDHALQLFRELQVLEWRT